LLAIFELFDEWFHREDFEACSFINVLLELGKAHPAGQASVHHLEAISQGELFWISTVRADGRPHVTPLVAVWLDAQQLDRLAEAWTQKWDGRWHYEVSQDGFRRDGGTALVFAVRPAKVLAFTKGGFGHTRHRL